MRKIVLTTTLLLLFTKGFCQGQDSTAKIIFGFDVGLNYTNLQTKNVDPAFNSENSAGFRIGVLMDMRLTNHLSFSPKAELSFYDSKIIVDKDPDGKETYHVNPVLMEFAPHVTYKFCSHKTSPYILFGLSYKVPITGDKKIQYASMRSDIALDLGFGLDKKLQFFNIAPELRYSLSLTNLNSINNVGQLYFHNVTLVLIFKG